MSDSHVEVSREGYLGRIGGAIKGVFFGGILFVASFAVLFWNEGRAVNRTRALNDTAASTVAVDAKAVNPANEGKPVHFTGDAAGERLADATFGVARDAIHLHRVAEMYQWEEDEKRERKRDTVGGGRTTKTTYTYRKVWKDHVIDSSSFKRSAEHQNPTSMRVQGETWAAKQVNVGAYRLPPSLVGEIDNFQPVAADESMLAKLPVGFRRGTIVSDGKFYLPNAATAGRVAVDPQSPQVGDIRVSFKAVFPGPVSVVARQAGKTLEAFQTAGGPVEILYVGTHSADAMFKSEHSNNTVLTWILRLVGFAAMWIGLGLALNPLKVLADVVGILGDLAGVGIGLVSGLAAVVLSLTTIASAWLFYRPVLGIGLFAVAAAGGWWFTRLRKKGHARFEQQRQQGAAGPGVTPPLPPLPAAPLPPVPDISRAA